MLEVKQAQKLVLEHAERKPPVRVPLARSLGLVLAEAIASDVDSPPHDKSIVDGYAVIAADFESGQAELRVLEEVTAGQVPTLPITRGTATRIMTGAPIPECADAVVMVEQTTSIQLADASPGVRIDAPRVRLSQNIMWRASSIVRGQQVLKFCCQIDPVAIGVLAEVGRSEVLVHPRPSVAVLATGNELVDAAATPAAGQIRNSNGPMLAALVESAGGIPLDLGIARDDEQSLTTLIARGLAADVLLLSGGVSAGVLDLVPSVLAKLGVRQIFHKVNLKPGKPIWFGVLESINGKRLVFGLPGNPVSSLVCFELFVRFALKQLLGDNPLRTQLVSARLEDKFEHRGDRPTYYPARITHYSSDPPVAPGVGLLDWQGSADLFTLTRANALVCFPGGDRSYAAEELVTVYPLP